jgi:hypothetical protein
MRAGPAVTAIAETADGGYVRAHSKPATWLEPPNDRLSDATPPAATEAPDNVKEPDCPKREVFQMENAPKIMANPKFEADLYIGFFFPVQIILYKGTIGTKSW